VRTINPTQPDSKEIRVQASKRVVIFNQTEIAQPRHTEIKGGRGAGGVLVDFNHLVPVGSRNFSFYHRLSAQ